MPGRGPGADRQPASHSNGIAGLLALLAATLLSVATAQAAPNQLSLSKPWMRFLTPEIPAAGYFTLHNSGSEPAKLTGASSPACGELMLHESMVMNGTAQMQMVSSVTVPAHGAVEFHPGGYHLMCMHPAADMAPGKHVPVSLHFADGTSLSASFPVYGAKGK